MISRTFALLALLSTFACAQQSGQDPTGHGQTPSSAATSSSQHTDSKTDLSPAGTSLRDQFKVLGKSLKGEPFQVAHQKPVVRRDPFQKRSPK